MDHAKWQKIEELFIAGLDLPAEKRAAFLEAACAADAELKSEVELLLKNAEKEDSFLGRPQFSLGLAVLDKEKNQTAAGEKIGRYQIIKLLGEGGMGEVYLAEDLPLNRLVALKLLPSYLIADNEIVTRFQREARAASAISHPNIAHIYEAGIENERRFIAMEFVEGTTLRELFKRRKLDLVTALDIILQTAGALASAHSAGIVHRDIKPENIMIRRDGYVKVLDFGIAKLLEKAGEDKLSQKSPSLLSGSVAQHHTNPGLVMGTIGYISPEQLNNEDVDLRTDIWSLGVVLYEAASGSRPFKGKTTEEIAKAILNIQPPVFSLSAINSESDAALQIILAKMLDKDGAKRYQSAGELAQDIKLLKQNLEFDRQGSASEIITDQIPVNDSGQFEQAQNTSFITKSKQFWTQQSLSRKALLLAVLIGIMTFVAGASFQYFNRFFINGTSKFQSFSPDSRGNWQITTLFGVRRKAQGMIPAVSFSPDAKSVAFAMSGEGEIGIYVKRLGQNNPAKLTDGKWNNQTPVWSPDGQQIAFVSNRDNKSAIWTISPDGGSPILKTNLAMDFNRCQLLKWSNDEKRLYFQQGRALKTIELDSGKIEDITLPVENIGAEFSISQDETLVAFVTLEGDLERLWIYNLKSEELTEVIDQVNTSLSPVLLSDNKRLIFSSNQNGNFQLYTADITSRKTAQITFGDSAALPSAVSADGRKIVFISQTDIANIFALDINSKKESRLTEETRMQLFPDISKDRTKLAFQITRDASNFAASPLKVKNLRTGNEFLLESQIGFWAKWSPVNDEIAYLRRVGIGYEICKIDFTNNQTKQLTSGGISFEGMSILPFNLLSFPYDWSSDGKKLTFVSTQSKISNVRVMDSDGANEQKLTDNDNPKIQYTSATWSPDGSKIAFNQRLYTETNKSEYSICVIKSGQIKEVFRDKRKIRFLGWGKKESILWASVYGPNETEIYELSETAAPKLLIKLEKADFFSLALSPAGNSIVYTARREGIDNIFSFSVNSGEKQLTDNSDDNILFSGISWSPAGDRIFYSKQLGSLEISMISDNSEPAE